jgi:methionyl-tRNA formyltransferase
MLAERSDVAGVVTQPDRPSGRGHKATRSPVKTTALDLGLRVYEPEKLGELRAELAGERYDLFALASYGRIVPPWLLAVPRLGALNVHPSMLPAYRGATPIQSALRDGAETTGVTIMLMDEGMDTGDIVLQEPVAIEPGENYGALHDRLALVGARLLDNALASASSGVLHGRPQTGDATYTRPLGKGDLAIDWSWPPQQIVNAVRAYSPQPGARAELDGITVKVLSAHVAGDAVEIDELIAPNRGRMSGAAFLRGRQAR